MSIQAMVWVITSSKAKLGARLALLSIANHSDANGCNAFPSIATIASEAGLCERQAQRAIARLEAIGELMIERGVGRGRTSRFVIAGMGGILPPISQEKVTSAPKKVTSAPKKGVENVTRTLRGTVKEESEEETTAIAVAKKPTAARGTRWPSGEGTYPEGKTVPLEWLKEGREWRPDLDMSNQSYLFEDYWVAKPGPNALKLDWRATWRNWVRNAKPDRPVNGHAYGGGLH